MTRSQSDDMDIELSDLSDEEDDEVYRLDGEELAVSESEIDSAADVLGKLAAARAAALDWRHKVTNFLEDPLSTKPALAYSFFMFGVILISTCTFLVGTHPNFTEPLVDGDGQPHPAKSLPLELIEMIVIAIFSLDYFLRLVFTRQMRFFWLLQPLNIIDLVAIVPFFIDLALAGASVNVSALIILRVLRLLRVFRIFKLARNNKNLPIIAAAFKTAGVGFGLAFFMLYVACVIFGSIVYFAEQTGCQVRSSSSSDVPPPPFPLPPLPPTHLPTHSLLTSISTTIPVRSGSTPTDQRPLFSPFLIQSGLPLSR